MHNKLSHFTETLLVILGVTFIGWVLFLSFVVFAVPTEPKAVPGPSPQICTEQGVKIDTASPEKRVPGTVPTFCPFPSPGPVPTKDNDRKAP